MVKTTTITTTEKYDKDGKLLERITKEKTVTDDETRFPVTPNYNPGSWNMTHSATTVGNSVTC